MKSVTRYKSNDGAIWETESSATKRDDLLKLANTVNRILPSAVDDSCSFANGGGFIQHSQESVQLFIDSLAGLIQFECGPESETLKLFKKNPRGIVGRYLDDGGTLAYKIWVRLISIDDQNREWGQPSCVIGDKILNQYKPWPKVSPQDFENYAS